MFQNNEKGLLTIVIPIYNVEKYLSNALIAWFIKQPRILKLS